MAGEVHHPQRLRQVTQVAVDVGPAGYLLQPLELPGRQAGSQQRLHLSRVVQDGHDAVAALYQESGVVQGALQHRFQILALVDAEAGLAETAQAAQGFQAGRLWSACFHGNVPNLKVFTVLLRDK